LYEKALNNYQQKMKRIAEQVIPVINDVYERQSHQYENILVPFTDGLKVFQVLVNLKAAYESKGKEVVKSFEKTSILATIDEAWKEHLREMDDLKQSVQNASYEQKDPLLIYKFESYELFKTMLDKNNKTVVNALLKAKLFTQDANDIQQGRLQKLDISKYDTEKEEYGKQGVGQTQGQEKQKVQPVRVGKKYGRNDIVKVKYATGKVMETKYKKIEHDIENGNAVLIE
jgi:preprotein translocase subunit SecA